LRCSRRFTREGARVALTDVRAAEGARLRAEIEAAGGQALYVDGGASLPR